MEPDNDFINQMKKAEEERKYNEYLQELQLKKEHKKIKQLLRGTGRFNPKRLRERNELFKKMEEMVRIQGIQE